MIKAISHFTGVGAAADAIFNGADKQCVRSDLYRFFQPAFQHGNGINRENR